MSSYQFSGLPAGKLSADDPRPLDLKEDSGPVVVSHPVQHMSDYTSPVGWDKVAYALYPKGAHYARTESQLAPGCQVQQYRYFGPMRFSGQLQPGRVQIWFIDSISDDYARMLDRTDITSILMVSVGGDVWDGVSDVYARGLCIDFTGALATDLAAAGNLLSGRGGQFGDIGNASPMFPLTPVSNEIKKRVLSALRAEGAGSGVAPGTPEFTAELIEMCRNLLHQISLGDYLPNINWKRRLAIGCRVEQLLFERLRHHDIEGTALDAIAAELGVAPRTIQLALHENFRTTFVALKTSIMLHMVHRDLLGAEGAVAVTAAASKYGFGNLGRFSGQYKKLFGVTPSQDSRLRHPRPYRLAAPDIAPLPA